MSNIHKSGRQTSNEQKEWRNRWANIWAFDTNFVELTLGTGDGLYKHTLFLHSDLLLYFISCYERCFHFSTDRNGWILWLVFGSLVTRLETGLDWSLWYVYFINFCEQYFCLQVCDRCDIDDWSTPTTTTTLLNDTPTASCHTNDGLGRAGVGVGEWVWFTHSPLQVFLQWNVPHIIYWCFYT